MKKLPRLQWYDLMLFTMKISVAQFLIALLFGSFAWANDSAAQGVLDKKVTIRIENVELKNALTRLERLAHTRFAYSPNIVHDMEKVTLNADEEKLGDLLSTLLSPMGISFEVIADRISLFKTPKGKDSSSLLYLDYKGLDTVITGEVTDERGQTLPGVNIIVKGTTNGTTTDAQGKYSIRVEGENSVLVFSFIGYVLQEVGVGSRTQIDVSLMPAM